MLDFNSTAAFLTSGATVSVGLERHAPIWPF